MKKRFSGEGRHIRRTRILLIVFCACMGALTIFSASLIDARGTGTISGTVFDERGPVTGARVRLQGTENSVVTDGAGCFILTGVSPEKVQNVSAWKEGYYSALLKDVRAQKEAIRLILIRYQMNDNQHYEWIPPEGAKGSCVECHPTVTAMSLNDAHLKAAVNPRFLTM